MAWSKIDPDMLDPLRPIDDDAGPAVGLSAQSHAATLGASTAQTMTPNQAAAAFAMAYGPPEVK